MALDDFLADVQPQFRNNILNPSGFLIDRARRFHRLTRPAVAPPKSVQAAVTAGAGICERYVGLRACG